LPIGFTLLKTTPAERWLPSTIFSLAFFAASVTWFVCKSFEKDKTIDNSEIKKKMIDLHCRANSIERYLTPVVATNDCWLASQ